MIVQEMSYSYSLTNSLMNWRSMSPAEINQRPYHLVGKKVAAELALPLLTLAATVETATRLVLCVVMAVHNIGGSGRQFKLLLNSGVMILVTIVCACYFNFTKNDFRKVSVKNYLNDLIIARRQKGFQIPVEVDERALLEKEKLAVSRENSGDASGKIKSKHYADLLALAENEKLIEALYHTNEINEIVKNSNFYDVAVLCYLLYERFNVSLEEPFPDRLRDAVDKQVAKIKALGVDSEDITYANYVFFRLVFDFVFHDVKDEGFVLFKKEVKEQILKAVVDDELQKCYTTHRAKIDEILKKSPDAFDEYEVPEELKLVINRVKEIAKTEERGSFFIHCMKWAEENE